MSKPDCVCTECGHAKPYAVNLWGSHPDEDNDDCWTGDEFDSLEEALSVYHNPFSYFKGENATSTAYIEIDGLTDDELKALGIERCRKNPIHKPSRKDDDSEWRREMANEAGMLHGVEAYNEVMGFD